MSSSPNILLLKHSSGLVPYHGRLPAGQWRGSPLAARSPAVSSPHKMVIAAVRPPAQTPPQPNALPEGGRGVRLVQERQVRPSNPSTNCVFVRPAVINSTLHCLAYCMFVDVGNAIRIARSYPRYLCRQIGNYETRSISLVNYACLHSCSVLIDSEMYFLSGRVNFVCIAP